MYGQHTKHSEHARRYFQPIAQFGCKSVPHLEHALVEAPGGGAQVLEEGALVGEGEVEGEVARIVTEGHLADEVIARHRLFAAAFQLQLPLLHHVVDMAHADLAVVDVGGEAGGGVAVRVGAVPAERIEALDHKLLQHRERALAARRPLHDFIYLCVHISIGFRVM